MPPKVFTPDAFVISDLHLGHKNIINYTRPQFTTIEEHDDFVVDSLARNTTKDDILFILGDVAFSKEALHKLSQARAKMVLIGGNHDFFSPSSYAPYFWKMYGVGEIGHGNLSAVLTHIPIHESCLNRWDFNIHGHLHAAYVNRADHDEFHGYNVYREDKRYINVCCEALAYIPRRISDLMDERPRE